MTRILNFDTVVSMDSELSDRNLDFDSIDEDLGERMLDFNSESSYSFDGSISSIDEDLSDLNSVSSSCHLDNSVESDMSDSVCHGFRQQRQRQQQQQQLQFETFVKHQ